MIFAQSIIFVLSFVNLAKACIETIVAYHISDFEIFLNFSKRPLLWTETWLAELPKVLNYFESHRQWVQRQTQDQSGSEFMPEEIHKCHTTLLNTGPITNQTIVSRQYYGQFLINAIWKNKKVTHSRVVRTRQSYLNRSFKSKWTIKKLYAVNFPQKAWEKIWK